MESQALVFDGKPAVALVTAYKKEQPEDAEGNPPNDPDADKEVWHFYLDEKSGRLLGCSFVRPWWDTRPNETIFYRGEMKIGNMRLPREHHWYVTDDMRHLGTDTLTKAEPLQQK